MRIVIIGKNVGCAWCERAKKFLDEKQLEYTYFAVEDHPVMRDLLVAMGIRTVPAVFVEGLGGGIFHLGGYNELQEHVR